MKIVYSILFLLFFNQASFADVTLLNKSFLYDLDITYKYCYLSNHGVSCEKTYSGELTVKNANNKDNYVSFAIPKYYKEQSNIIEIESVIARNSTGEVIATSKYIHDAYAADSNCYAYHKDIYHDTETSPGYEHGFNVLFSFNELPQLNSIQCSTSAY